MGRRKWKDKELRIKFTYRDGDQPTITKQQVETLLTYFLRSGFTRADASAVCDDGGLCDMVNVRYRRRMADDGLYTGILPDGSQHS